MENKLDWDIITGGKTYHRERVVEEVLKKLTTAERDLAHFEECADENTGVRYGRAKKRLGRCAKIGGGGRNRGSRRAYQVWLVW